MFSQGYGAKNGGKMDDLIEFRGKDVETNEWVYGNLELFKTHYPSITWMDDAFDKVKHHCTVYPNSVGQYTGFSIPDGGRIYAGDIIRTSDSGKLYVVKFWHGMFYASVEECNKGIYGGYPLYFFMQNLSDGFTIEIVGNTFDDNNLLIKGK